MIPKQIFYYWEGRKYPYIKHCIDSIENRTGVKTIFLNPWNIDEYISGIDINPNWRKIKTISQKVDILRIAVLYKYGGMYLDADTVIIKDFNNLFLNLPDKDVITMQWKINKKILNGYFFAQQNSVFLSLCLQWINERLTDGLDYYSQDQGVYFGEVMFKEISDKNKELVGTIDSEVILPIQFPFSKDVWFKCIPVEYYIKNTTLAIGLNHSQYSFETKQKSIDDIVKTCTLFGNIFNYSQKLGKL